MNWNAALRKSILSRGGRWSGAQVVQPQEAKPWRLGAEAEARRQLKEEERLAAIAARQSAKEAKEAAARYGG